MQVGGGNYLNMGTAKALKETGRNRQKERDRQRECVCVCV